MINLDSDADFAAFRRPALGGAAVGGGVHGRVCGPSVAASLVEFRRLVN